MGWASAGGYFDAVADTLIEGGAIDAVKTQVCSVMIGVFRDGDWDTEDESLSRYADDPAIVAAFAQHEIYLPCPCGCEPDEPCECTPDDCECVGDCTVCDADDAPTPRIAEQQPEHDGSEQR